MSGTQTPIDETLPSIPNGGSINKSTSSTGTSTPKLTNFSLTENTTNISPTPGTPQNRPQFVIPQQFLLPNGYPDYLKLILTSRVYEVVTETPLTHAVNLSNRLECCVLLKREDLQPVFSFKLRGAYNKMAHLTDNQRWKGVVCCSAGNHAQGVAFSARKLKIPATIVMPQGTPDIKHRNVSRLGGSVILRGGDFDAAKEEAHRLEVLHGLTNIPPFDDPYVIAGQGTIGMELLRQTNLTELEAIFCCVGGGGLIAGIGVYIKRIAPQVKIIGVETRDANAMVSSLAAGYRVPLKDVGLFADGKAVKFVGEETFRICSEVVDDIIQVDTDEICAAIKDVFEDTRSILEPAGALSLAGLKRYVANNPSEHTNRNLVALCSGANMDFDRLRFVAERAALGERKEALLSVTIPEKPGSFAALVKTVHPYNITEFSYRFHRPSAAHVILGVAVSPTQLPNLISRLNNQNMPTVDLSSNELAKSHIRYLVGGRLPVVSTPQSSKPLTPMSTNNTEGEPEPLYPSQTTERPPNDPTPPPGANGDATSSAPPLKQERLFRFEFPERAGALHRFLTALTAGFNISLWHYRNYGGDQAKILAGIQVPLGADDELAKFLERVGYPWTEETDNECYQMFLRDTEL